MGGGGGGGGGESKQNYFILIYFGSLLCGYVKTVVKKNAGSSN